MCVFVRIIITTFCLCASSKMLDSIPIPVLIGNLQENEVMDLLILCDKFVGLKMRNGTIYTATDERQVPLTEHITSTDMIYKGTAMVVNYNIPVVNKTLLEIWQDRTFRPMLNEISIRIINVVESVGIFLLIKISMLARDIVCLSQMPEVLMRIILRFLDKINHKFYELNISSTPIEHLREIMLPYTSIYYYSVTNKAHFCNESTRFMDKYSYLSGFVDIGNVDLTRFDPTTDTIEEFLSTQIVFIRTKVNNYFII